MKNILMIIAIAVLATAFINCGSNMSLNPSDDEIALCNENPSTCNIGEEIVMENGSAVAKETGGDAIRRMTSVSKSISTSLLYMNKADKETGGD